MTPDPARALAALQRIRLDHGAGLAERRLMLLRRLARARLRSAAQVRELHELLCFARAYPDDARVLATAARLLRSFHKRADLRRHRDELYASGIAGTTIWFPFFYATARWVAGRWPRQLILDRSDSVAEASIAKTLPALLTPLEAHALRESHLPGYAALDRVRGPRNDATFLIERVAAMPGDEITRATLYDAINPSCELIPAAATPTRTTADYPVRTTFFRSTPVRRDRPDLRAEIVRAPASPRRLRGVAAGRLIELARAAMATRERDLDAFAHANPRDVWWVDDERGLAFALIGVAPAQRPALPAIYGGLTLQNGVPIGYHQSDLIGPSAAVSFNTFETFRGAESAHVFARLLAVLHALFGATSFSIEPYQLGDRNDEGIESGAWWFYTKLGFRPRAAAARRLAAAESARLRRNPAEHSTSATLRQLAQHHLFLDLDSGAPGPLVLPAAIGLAAARFISELDADRPRALAIAESRARAACGIGARHRFSGNERIAWQALFPLLAMLPTRGWTKTRRARLAQLVRAKAAASELGYVQALDSQPEVLGALARLSSQAGTSA